MNYYIADKNSALFEDYSKRDNFTYQKKNVKAKELLEKYGIEEQYIGIRDDNLFVVETAPSMKTALRKEFKVYRDGWLTLRVKSKIYKEWQSILKELEPTYKPYSSYNKSLIYDFDIRMFWPQCWGFSMKINTCDDFLVLEIQNVNGNERDLEQSLEEIGLKEISKKEYLQYLICIEEKKQAKGN